MKRELFVHFSFLLTFFILVSFIRGWISISYWPFWLGGIIGMFLPDLDHILYVYVLRPYELTPQRAIAMAGKGKILGMFHLLTETRRERKSLIFHTVIFQVIFTILTFLIVTSSTSLIGLGVVLSASLHLVVDQLLDFLETDSLDNWFWQTGVQLEKSKTVFYWLASLLALLALGFLL